MYKKAFINTPVKYYKLRNIYAKRYMKSPISDYNSSLKYNPSLNYTSPIIKRNFAQEMGDNICFGCMVWCYIFKGIIKSFYIK